MGWVDRQTDRRTNKGADEGGEVDRWTSGRGRTIKADRRMGGGGQADKVADEGGRSKTPQLMR